MFGQYEENNFEEFADLLHQAFSRLAAGKGEIPIESLHLDWKSWAPLEKAVKVFNESTTIKPDHLVALQQRLDVMGISEETSARYCLQVEALRIASHRGIASPLLDRRAPSDPALGLWWNRIQDWTKAWDYDPTLDDRETLQQNLPLNEHQAEAIQSEVFGTRSAAAELI